MQTDNCAASIVSKAWLHLYISDMKNERRQQQKSWPSLRRQEVGGLLPLLFVLISVHILLQHSISTSSFLTAIEINTIIPAAL